MIAEDIVGHLGRRNVTDNLEQFRGPRSDAYGLVGWTDLKICQQLQLIRFKMDAFFLVLPAGDPLDLQSCHSPKTKA